MEGRRRQPMMRIVLAPRENVNCTRTDRTKSGACLQPSLHVQPAGRLIRFPRIENASVAHLPALVIAAHVDFNASPNRRATPIDRQSHTL